MGLKEIVLKIKLTNDKIAHLWAVFDVMTFLEAQMTQVWRGWFTGSPLAHRQAQVIEMIGKVKGRGVNQVGGLKSKQNNII